MKIFNVIICCMVIMGCESKKERMHRVISGSTFKLWKKQNAIHDGKTQTIYYFDDNNKWLVFNLYYNGVLKKYDGGDIILNEKWGIENDSTIIIGGLNYKVILCNDSMINYYESLYGNLSLTIADDSVYKAYLKREQ